MIKPTELRLNNWVQLADMEAWHIDWPKPQEPFQVTKEVIEDLFINENNGFSMSFLEPIPITEQWLLDFGFVSGNNFINTKGHWSKGKFVLMEFDWDDEGKLYHLFKTLSGELTYWKHGKVPTIKHIHQLQNLYYSLTGQELKSTKTLEM